MILNGISLCADTRQKNKHKNRGSEGSHRIEIIAVNMAPKTSPLKKMSFINARAVFSGPRISRIQQIEFIFEFAESFVIDVIVVAKVEDCSALYRAEML